VLFLTAPKRQSSEAPRAALFTPIIGPSSALISMQRSW